jgi:hypothetical protein
MKVPVALQSKRAGTPRSARCALRRRRRNIGQGFEAPAVVAKGKCGGAAKVRKMQNEYLSGEMDIGVLPQAIEQ